MLGKVIDRLLHDEENAPVPAPRQEIPASGEKHDRLIAWAIFVLAAAVRLGFIFFVSEPENAGMTWYGDTYHRWQVAYLTREIGWPDSHRLWDLKGMEYFWGIVHPLLLNLLFSLTGRVDIWLGRVLTALAGAGLAGLMYLLGRRYFNRQLGLALGLFTALFSIGIFNDASGSVEPLGFLFLLAGIWHWPKNPWLTGIFWAVAAMTRAEMWLLSLGLLLYLLLFGDRRDKWLAGLAAWLVPILAYMKYLAAKTGNYIYPIYWNFLANARGVWSDRLVPDGPEAAAKPYFIVLLLSSLAGLAWVVIKRSKKPDGLWLALMFGNSVFIMGMMGLSSYLLSYEPWFWMIRFFVLPYLLAALLLGLFLFVWLKRVPVLSWLVWLAVLGVTVLAWRPVLTKYRETMVFYEQIERLGRQISSLGISGRFLISENEPAMTYGLVRFGGIRGRQLISQMFDPFYYQADHAAVIRWFKEEKIEWLLLARAKTPRYDELISREAAAFKRVAQLPLSYDLYQVDLGRLKP